MGSKDNSCLMPIQMTSHIDFFELKTPADLLRKLESDLVSLEESGQDTKIAFNFFVTAEHLPDWLNRRDLVQKTSILRIVSHIANGAKHFYLNDKRHTSVKSTEKFRVFEEGVVENGYFYEPLVIHLSKEEEKDLGFSEIDAVTLGHKVIEFWRLYVPAS